MNMWAWRLFMLLFLELSFTTALFADTGNWKIQKDDSPISDKKIVRLLLAANQDIKIWPGISYRPVLILRCKDKKFSAFVRIGASLKLERHEYKLHTVTVKFDNRNEYDEKVGPSTNRKAFFFKGVVTEPKIFGGVVAQMLKSKKAVMRFTPFNSDPAIATFDVRGLQEAIKPLAEACNISN